MARSQRTRVRPRGSRTPTAAGPARGGAGSGGSISSRRALRRLLRSWEARHLLAEVACGFMARGGSLLDLKDGPGIVRAHGLREGASRMERTARRKPREIRDRSGEGGQRSVVLVLIRRGAEGGFRVRMAGGVVDVINGPED